LSGWSGKEVVLLLHIEKGKVREGERGRKGGGEAAQDFQKARCHARGKREDEAPRVKVRDGGASAARNPKARAPMIRKKEEM